MVSEVLYIDTIVNKNNQVDNFSTCQPEPNQGYDNRCPLHVLSCLNYAICITYLFLTLKNLDFQVLLIVRKIQVFNCKNKDAYVAGAVGHYSCGTLAYLDRTELFYFKVVFILTFLF